MRWFLISLSVLLLPAVALAQAKPTPVVLVADSVRIGPQDTLIAEGNVEVFQDSTSLTAERIVYDPDTEKLIIDGPLTLDDGNGAVIVASVAELDRDLTSGLLRSARLVLDQQLQLASAQIHRVNARYSQLYKTAVTSCRVCHPGEVPLWQIRATRVIHDQEEKQLYFEHAQFRIGSVPVFYLPRLRLPDPTLKRATGFLTPTITSNSILGNGVKVPYFIRIGDHKDLTLTPYWSPETRTVEFRYRQAFRTGRIEFNGAVSEDDIEDDRRYYVFGGGRFDLRRNFKLKFDIEAVSDDAYLSLYDYSTKTRLDSEIEVSRVSRDSYFSAGAILYHSIRAGEVQATLPTLVLDTQYERRIFPTSLGGELRLAAIAHNHQRSSTSTVSGQGRDVTRVEAKANWLRSWDLAGGLRGETDFGLALETIDTRQDMIFGGTRTRALPTLTAALRYPLRKTTGTGVKHYLEPVVQIGWTGGDPINVAVDESTRVEFDEGNLFALSRFPEIDRREHGAVAAIGVHWARFDPAGWETHLTVGQIFRENEVPEFSSSTGLDGKTSDFLVAGQILTQSGLAFTARALMDNDLNFSRAELRGDWTSKHATVGGSYVWLETDPAENRSKAVSELALNANRRFAKHWTVSGEWRYDFEDDRTAVAGIGLGYDNECVSVDFTAERRFSSSANIEPSTSFGLTIALRGFSAQTGTESYTRTCSSPDY
ncbi:MAG: LPS assembly protein LptD [Pseudomonadota bacterium]